MTSASASSLEEGASGTVTAPDSRSFGVLRGLDPLGSAFARGMCYVHEKVIALSKANPGGLLDRIL